MAVSVRCRQLLAGGTLTHRRCSLARESEVGDVAGATSRRSRSSDELLHGTLSSVNSGFTLTLQYARSRTQATAVRARAHCARDGPRERGRHPSNEPQLVYRCVSSSATVSVGSTIYILGLCARVWSVRLCGYATSASRRQRPTPNPRVWGHRV